MFPTIVRKNPRPKENTREGPPKPAVRRLTHRDIWVITEYSNGRTGNDIADQLQLTPNAVYQHTWRIMRKLKVHTVAGIVAYALRNGYIV